MVDEPRESVKYAMTRKIWSKYRIPKKTNQKPDADAGDSESVAESPETTGRELTLNEKPTPNPAQNGLAHETTPNHNLELHATRCSKLHGLHHLADPKYGIHHLPDPNSRCASRMVRNLPSLIPRPAFFTKPLLFYHPTKKQAGLGTRLEISN